MGNQMMSKVLTMGRGLGHAVGQILPVCRLLEASAGRNRWGERSVVALRFTLVVVLVGWLPGSQAEASVVVTYATKTQAPTSMTMTGGMVTVTWTTTLAPDAVPGPGPVGIPTLSLDLYDSDLIFNDAVGVDLTDTSPGVTVAGSGWTPGPTSKNILMPPMVFQEWTYKWNLPNITVLAQDGAGSPDPFVKVTTTGPAGGMHTVAAPNLPSVGMADVGVTGPAGLANITSLVGLPITAFSRGYDEISGLATAANPTPSPIDAALYFSVDAATTSGAPGLTTGPGTMYVLDPVGNGWEEEAYGGVTMPRVIDYLNVNTAMPLAGLAATDFFLVQDNSSAIEYAATGDPNSTSTYLSVSTGGLDIAALAVEDVGVRGLWDAGDSILYAVENSSIITKLSFGGVASPLTANSVTFDGTGTLSFDHLEPTVLSGQTMLPGSITSLSVASAVELVKPIPSDRGLIDFNLNAVPEGSTFAMAMVALGMLSACRRRAE
jgi:hypothetical protein